MELKELTEKTLKLFDAKNTKELIQNIPKHFNDENNMAAFEKMVNDLSIDWLQKIFQYYEADRKDKKQDYTPTTVARLIGTLCDDNEIIDMCAGSGALTIQKWDLNHDIKVQCYELDKKVIPILLYNLSIRNIEGKVFQVDILQNEIYDVWTLTKGERYSKINHDISNK